MSPKDICEALMGALTVCYVVYNEIRMQQLKRADEGLKRELSDEQITDGANALNNSELANKLSEELGRSNIKPKT